jgi:peptidase S41-like protein
MRRRVARGLILVLLALVPLSAPAWGDARIDRLARVAKLWGMVKFSDPYVWEHDVDLDKALIDSLPKISAARTTEDYRAAVAALLAEIGDPVTRVVDASEEPGPLPDASGPFTRVQDGVLVVTLRRRPSATPLKDVVASLLAEVASAKAVVFDLRGGDGRENALFAELGNIFSRRILVEPVRRRLFFSGFEAQDALLPSGSYYSSMMVDRAREFPPRAGRHARRTVFLVNNDSPVPSLVFAAVAAGQAWMVSDGRFVADTETPLDMGEGVEVVVRTDELFPPVSADIETTPGKDPLAAALALAKSARTKKAPAGSGSALAPLRRRVDSPYAESAYPSKELRLLALFRYWNVIHRFYPYLGLIGDWDAVLPEFIPKLEEAADATAYALALAELATHVPDGHSRLRSAALAAYFGEATPPVTVRMIEGRPVIVKTSKPDIGASVGDIILAVDGEPAASRMERIGKYVPASTPAAHAQYVAARLLSGPADSVAAVTLQGADDKPRTVQLPREKPTPTPDPPKADIIKILPGDIGYVDLRYLEVVDVPAMFQALEKTKAIIFDLRGYPRQTVWAIAPRINRKHARLAAHFERNLLTGGLPSRLVFDQQVPPWNGTIYDRPTLMLVDDRTISQAEHTGLFFEATSGTRFVGSNTAGANGDITTIVLPGEITVWMTGHDVRHIDGRQLQRVGLEPDVRVEPTIAGIRAGRDEVLEAALRALGAKKKCSPIERWSPHGCGNP